VYRADLVDDEEPDKPRPVIVKKACQMKHSFHISVQELTTQVNRVTARCGQRAFP
jgi:hypothetical protein